MMFIPVEGRPAMGVGMSCPQKNAGPLSRPRFGEAHPQRDNQAPGNPGDPSPLQRLLTLAAEGVRNFSFTRPVPGKAWPLTMSPGEPEMLLEGTAPTTPGDVLLIAGPEDREVHLVRLKAVRTPASLPDARMARYDVLHRFTPPQTLDEAVTLLAHQIKAGPEAVAEFPAVVHRVGTSLDFVHREDARMLDADANLSPTLPLTGRGKALSVGDLLLFDPPGYAETFLLRIDNLQRPDEDSVRVAATRLDRRNRAAVAEQLVKTLAGIAPYAIAPPQASETEPVKPAAVPACPPSDDSDGPRTPASAPRLDPARGE